MSNLLSIVNVHAKNFNLVIIRVRYVDREDKLDEIQLINGTCTSQVGKFM